MPQPKKATRGRSKKSRRPAAAGQHRKSRTHKYKTRRVASKKSKTFERHRPSKARSGMSMTELEFLAKSRGIPFGGLNKTQLIRKINNYY